MTAAPSALAPAGIGAVDSAWGGLRSGASILLVGRAASGRTALALQSVRAAIAAGQTALLLSPRPPATLNETAQSAGFDLAALHASGRLRVLRVPAAKDLAAKGNDGLRAAYRDLAGLVAKSGADRVVIEDLTPLVQFSTFEAFGEAFDAFRQSLNGAALVVGLGEPANEPSRRLIETVQKRMDGTVRVAGDDVRFETAAAETAAAAAPPMPSAPEPAPAPAPPPAPAMVPPSPAPLAAAPEQTEPLAPEPFDPATISSDGASVPVEEPTDDLPPPAPEPIRAEPTVTLETPASDPLPLESLAPPPAFPDAAPSTPTPSIPASSADAPAPEPQTDVPAAPEAFPAAPQALAASPQPPATADGILSAGVEPAPPPDPELMAPGGDTFARDPGATFFEHGYLVDSKGAATTPLSPGPAPQEMAPPAPQPPAGPTPVAPAAMPSFAPVAPTPPTAEGPAAARQALAACFEARAKGTRFLVVAARMEASQPESAEFGAVVEGLRSALPTNGTLYADVSRLRSLLVLPGASGDAASGVFAALQQHLHHAIGQKAESTLRAVAAITVPDGQPFTTADELWQYAVES